MNNPKVEPGMNILRFYMDDDDKIIKCDYIENYERTKYSEIKLSQITLRDVLKKYMNNPRIYHQEVIKEKYIIYKFYDVDVDEIDALIELSNNVRDAITNPKFKKVEEHFYYIILYVIK